MTQIKICGITDTNTYAHCARHAVEWVGFVFFEKSPRHLQLEQAEQLVSLKNGEMKHVALTVNASDAMLTDIVSAAQPDMLQLHGDETPMRADAIQQKFGIPVMPVVKISAQKDVENASHFTGYCDWILFDAAPPADAHIPGGLGKSFDWTMLDDFSAAMPWMLAGGLNAGNVHKAIDTAQPDAVDTSSGVEGIKGIKDIALIDEFIAAVRSAAS